MTDPYRLTDAPAAAPARAVADRLPALHPLLWALVALCVGGNAAVSAGAGPSWLGVAFGLVTAVCVALLVRMHVRR